MCMQRYEYSVRAGLRRGKWDEEEDLRLSEAVAFYQEAANAERSGKLGIPWSKVARHVPGRTDPQCRERWTGKLDPTLNNSEWTEEESQVSPPADAPRVAARLRRLGSAPPCTSILSLTE